MAESKALPEVQIERWLIDIVSWASVDQFVLTAELTSPNITLKLYGNVGSDDKAKKFRKNTDKGFNVADEIQYCKMFKNKFVLSK